MNSVTSVVPSNIVQKNARSEKGMGHNGSCPNPASRKFDVWLQLPRQMRILLGKYVHVFLPFFEISILKNRFLEDWECYQLKKAQ